MKEKDSKFAEKQITYFSRSGNITVAEKVIAEPWIPFLFTQRRSDKDF